MYFSKFAIFILNFIETIQCKRSTSEPEYINNQAVGIHEHRENINQVKISKI